MPLFTKKIYTGVSPQRYNELLIAYRELQEEKKRLQKTLIEVKSYLMRSKKLTPIVKFIDDALK